MRASAASLTAVAAGNVLASTRASAAAGDAGTGSLGAGPPEYVGAGATAGVRPFALHKVTLGSGLLKEKQKRLLAFARAYDERRFLVLFNQTAGRPNPARRHRSRRLGGRRPAERSLDRALRDDARPGRLGHGRPADRGQAALGRRRARRLSGRAGREGAHRAPRLPRRQARGHRPAARSAAIRGLRRQPEQARSGNPSCGSPRLADRHAFYAHVREAGSPVAQATRRPESGSGSWRATRTSSPASGIPTSGTRSIGIGAASRWRRSARSSGSARAS